MVHARYRYGAADFVSSIQLFVERIESADKYPFSIPAVAALKTKLVLSGGATFLVGENGSGKSTVVEAIAVAMGFNAEGGSKNFNFATRSSESELHRALQVAKGIPRPKTGYFLRAESFFNVATEIEELDKEVGGPPIIDSYGGTYQHEQSHGESFLALIQHRFGPNGLYILDEPEAALSPRRQLVLLKRMHELIKHGSQFIVATHSPILLALPGARILHLDENGITEIDYDHADPVQLTRAFLEDPKTFLEMLLPK